MNSDLCNHCESEASSIKDTEAFKYMSSSYSSFQMDQLVDLCSDEPMLVSDVLDSFCVQGRQRLESLIVSVEQKNLTSTIFDAVGLSFNAIFSFERSRDFTLACHRHQ